MGDTTMSWFLTREMKYYTRVRDCWPFVSGGRGAFVSNQRSDLE